MFKELKLTITHLSWHFSQFDSYLTSKFAYISILYKYQPSLSSFSLRTCQHCPLHFELFSWNPSNFFIQVEPYLRPPLIHLGITKFLFYGSKIEGRSFSMVLLDHHHASSFYNQRSCHPSIPFCACSIKMGLKVYFIQDKIIFTGDPISPVLLRDDLPSFASVAVVH